ncbi:MAG: DUF362 domain-containing protein [Armatimonadetes bacterium]|nr:DUF362 domain-containing protein [Armatimonadota bacterium]
MEKQSRREFLKGMTVVGAGVVGMGAAKQVLAQDKKEPALVVLARDPAAQGENHRLQPDVVRKMVFQGMKKLSGKKTDASAWKSYFAPDDVVGIKINCLFGRGASTHPEVVAAVVEGLKLAGVKANNIIVWDRSDGDLAKSGFPINREGPGVKCYGTNDDYEDKPVRIGSFVGRFSRILTQKITALVNVPILKDHGTGGVTIACKNHYGSFDNPGPYHGNNCDPFLAELCSYTAVRDKTRLIVCDAIRPLANGGPSLHNEFLWDYNGILVATDPIALDYQGWQIIEARRKEIGLPSLAEAGRPVRHLATGAKMGLGTNDPQKMRLIKIG